MSGLTPQMVEVILSGERYPVRFEDLCIDTIGEHQGVLYVRTSRSHDLGRDGRGVSAQMPEVPPLLACGTDDDPEKKAKGDLATILKWVSPEHLVFCFTAPVSESLAQKIHDHALSECKSLKTVAAFGVEQLADLIVEHPAAFEKYYAGEIASLKHAIAESPAKHPENELTGLQIALATQLHDDAQQHRSDVIRGILLSALADGTPATPRMLAKRATDALKLPRQLSPAWLTHDLNALEETGAVRLVANGVAFQLTHEGADLLKRTKELGQGRLVDGEKTVRTALEDLLGYPLSDIEFSRVWRLLQAELVALFVSHGAQLIQSIVKIATGEGDLASQDDLRARIKSLTTSISGANANAPRMQEIAQALDDLFHERTSPAFEWLSGVAEVFLQLCSLGMEPRAQQQLLERMRELELVIDTDVVLSLISEGETNHRAIRTMVDGWKHIGGRILVTPAVLQEIAHHAKIADVVFNHVSHALDKMAESDVQRLVDNVFVRGFWFESKRDSQKCTRTRWNYFIAAFRGKSETDVRKLVEMLSDLGVENLPEDPQDTERAGIIAQQLFEKRQVSVSGRVPNAALMEKCRCDGRMAASLLRHQTNLSSSGHSAALVSTSKALRTALSQALGSSDGEEPVLYSTAILWLLSQYPGVRITASMLHAVMFDVDFPIKLHPLEKKALRLFCTSEEHKVHFARRTTLREAMRTEIRKRAGQIGVNSTEVAKRVLSDDDENRELTTEIMSEVLDKISISKSERKIGELQAELRKLHDENEELRRRNR